MKNKNVILILILISVFLSLSQSFADEQGTTYYVSNAGNDSNTGTSPSSSWASLDKVNEYSFQAGDTVCFKNGDVFRGQLIPCSGNSYNNVVYTNYGSGEKPKILGSVSANESDFWRKVDNNIWVTYNKLACNQLINSSFDTDFGNWNFYSFDGAKGNIYNADYNTAPSCYQVSVAEQGANENDIQLFNDNISVKNGSVYRLRFRAKSSIDFTMSRPTLTKSTIPYNSYAVAKTQWQGNVTSIWQTYSIDFVSNVTAKDARLSFLFGNAMPKSADFYIDDVNLQEIMCYLPVDVGNVIFNNGVNVGFKKDSFLELAAQNDYWYDPVNYCVYIYSKDNPADMYDSVELALKKDIVNVANKSYVTIDGLDISKGGFHGISLMSSRFVTITNCDISYIGGSYWSGNIRAGNAIQLWDNVNDCTVTYNNINQIYDTGITNQGTVENNQQYNIYYRYNNISNCDLAAFEIWDNPASSSMHDIYFENNICTDIGGGWAFKQRDNKLVTSHIVMFNSAAAATNIFIRNNTFSNSKNYLIFKSIVNNIENFTIDYNTYIHTGSIVNWTGGIYNKFSTYQSDTDKDIQSKLN